MRGMGAVLALALVIAVPALARPAAAPRRAVAARIQAEAQQALEKALLDHITILASDDYQGREPGTDGEVKTLRYLGRQFADIGLVSGTNDPGHPWFAPVTVVSREPAVSGAVFVRRKRKLAVAPGSVLMLTSGKRSLVEEAPLLFVGRGLGPLPPRNELAGRVAVVFDNRGGDDDDDDEIRRDERQSALLKAGASAVLTVLDGDRSLAKVAERRQRPGYALAGDHLGGDLEGFITREAFAQLLPKGQTLAALEQVASRPGFTPRPLELTATLEATTRETTISSHNLIGKLPGKRPEAGAVLFLAHWDHFGSCAEQPAEHLICNGAVDNASGLAALIEVARRLNKPPQMDRDIYFLATTAEELGLLGAQAFAENPPLPLSRIVAAFNIDSIAIAPAGTPLGEVGKGMTRLDPTIAQVARAQGRKLAAGDGANAYLQRQDGWALLRHDVPAVMVTSAYGDIGDLEHYFDTDYHRPSDVVKPGLQLGGAAQDVAFLTALGRWFGDAKKVPAPR